MPQRMSGCRHLMQCLFLKAWKMRTDACTEREAHAWLAARWDRYEDYNHSFVQFLQTEWVTSRRP